MKRPLILIVIFILTGCGGGNKWAIRNYDGTRYPKTDYCEVRTFHSQYWFEKWLNEEFHPNEYALVGSTNWTSKTGFREKHAIKTCKNLGGDMAILLDNGVKYMESYNSIIV